LQLLNARMMGGHDAEIEKIKNVLLDKENENTIVAVDNGGEVTLNELLPERWDRKWA
jgi:hypothetical protein